MQTFLTEYKGFKSNENGMLTHIYGLTRTEFQSLFEFPIQQAKC